MGLPRWRRARFPLETKGHPNPLPWGTRGSRAWGERCWLPLTIVPQFGWCFGELDWLLQSSFKMDDPFLNHFSNVLDPLLLGFDVGSLERHRKKH